MKVWFHRLSAGFWAVVGVVSFALGWQNSVTLVWLASLYANIKTDWGAAEAADDKVVTEKLDEILRRIEGLIEALERRP